MTTSKGSCTVHDSYSRRRWEDPELLLLQTFDIVTYGQVRHKTFYWFSSYYVLKWEDFILEHFSFEIQLGSELIFFKCQFFLNKHPLRDNFKLRFWFFFLMKFRYANFCQSINTMFCIIEILPIMTKTLCLR